MQDRIYDCGATRFPLTTSLIPALAIDPENQEKLHQKWRDISALQGQVIRGKAVRTKKAQRRGSEPPLALFRHRSYLRHREYPQPPPPNKIMSKTIIANVVISIILLPPPSSETYDAG